MADDEALPSLKLVRSHLSCGRPNPGSQTAVAFDSDSQEAFVSTARRLLVASAEVESNRQ